MLPPYRAVATASPIADVQLVGGACIIGGWSFVETSGSASSQIELYDGSGTGGNLLTSITLSAGQSTRDLIGAYGLRVTGGLFLHTVSGATKGSVWIVTLEMVSSFALAQGIHPIWSGED